MKQMKENRIISTKNIIGKMVEMIGNAVVIANDKESKKLGDKYINKSLHLKDDFKKVDVENPNKFIIALFEMGVN